MSEKDFKKNTAASADTRDIRLEEEMTLTLRKKNLEELKNPHIKNMINNLVEKIVEEKFSKLKHDLLEEMQKFFLEAEEIQALNILRAKLISEQMDCTKFLQNAIANGNADMNLIKMLMKIGANPNALCSGSDNRYNSILHMMVYKHNENAIKTLLQIPEIDIYPRDESGSKISLYLYSVSRGYENITRMLLDTGKVEINERNNDGETALMLAIKGGYVNIIRMLLCVPGIDVNGKYKDGDTPLLHYISKNSDIAIVKMFLDNGADINQLGQDNNSPLMKALKVKREDLAELILDYDEVDINIKDFEDSTALIWAATDGYIKIVESLLSKNADINSVNKYGKTALDIAVDGKHMEIIKILIDCGADIHKKIDK